MTDPDTFPAPANHPTQSFRVASFPARQMINRLGVVAGACLIGVSMSGCSSTEDTASDVAVISAPEVDLRDAAIDMRRDPG